MIEMHWHDDSHTALMLTLEGAWTWEDLYGSVEESKAWMKEVAPTEVDILVQLRSNVLPRGSLNMHATAVLRRRSPNLARIIIITANPILRRLMDLTIRVNRDVAERYRIVTTLDQALELVAERLNAA